MALAVDRGALRAAYEDGASTVDLALAYGISRTTVRCLLQEIGCPLRDVREAAQMRATASWLRLPPPDKLLAETSVVDVDGLRQVVTHRTPTRHGFDICRGRGANGGPMAVILTKALAAHLERHRLDPRNLDLPIGQALMNRLRRRLDLDHKRENDAWWEARRDDLDTLPPDAFAEKHGTRAGTVMVMRLRLCGARPKRTAWLDETAKALVYSDRPAREVAEALGRTVAQVNGHRRSAMRKAENAKRAAAAATLPPSAVAGVLPVSSDCG